MLDFVTSLQCLKNHIISNYNQFLKDLFPNQMALDFSLKKCDFFKLYNNVTKIKGLVTRKKIFVNY